MSGERWRGAGVGCQVRVSGEGETMTMILRSPPRLGSYEAFHSPRSIFLFLVCRLG